MKEDPLKETIKAAISELLGLNGRGGEQLDFFQLVVELQQCKQELQTTHDKLCDAMQNWEVWHALAKAREANAGLLQDKLERMAEQLDCLSVNNDERC